MAPENTNSNEKASLCPQGSSLKEFTASVATLKPVPTPSDMSLLHELTLTVSQLLFISLPDERNAQTNSTGRLLECTGLSPRTGAKRQMKRCQILPTVLNTHTWLVDLDGASCPPDHLLHLLLLVSAVFGGGSKNHETKASKNVKKKQSKPLQDSSKTPSESAFQSYSKDMQGLYKYWLPPCLVCIRAG